MKRFIAIALSVLAGVFAVWFYCKSRVNSAGKTEKIALCVGTSGDYPPMEYYQDGVLTGFEVELVRLIGEKLGREIAFKDMEFTVAKDALAMKLIDVLAATITKSEEGVERFDFGIPYCRSKALLVSKKGRPITSAKDLFDKKVAYQIGPTWKKIMEKNLPEEAIIPMDRADICMEMLKSGQVDCVLIDEIVASIYCKNNSEYATYFLEDVFVLPEGVTNFGDEICIIFTKGSPLKAEFNGALKGLESSGELRALKKKWGLSVEWKLPNE
ncbi:MAG: ABC transporter substrate-binding protein [Puniceicoccales bacterium]|jgi:polar amino acid transport system substrate-binding protein|nr:ABC transporter substrate-binding protein [Puniceicoccales bacterium]